jgi:hypothetical protein
MIEYKRKFYFFKVTDSWFKLDFKTNDLFKLKMFNYIVQQNKRSRFLKLINTYSLQLSLLKEYDEIYKGFKSSCRNSIKKAESYGVRCDFINDIELFIEFYNEFAKLKNIYPANQNILYQLKDSLQISFAYVDNQLLVAHAHLYDSSLGITRLYLSASKRLDKQFNQNLISIANKFLTANDIEFFKKLNYKIYDFGGFAYNTSNKSLQGINEFKLLFGGEIVELKSLYTYPFYLMKILSEKLDRRYN